MSDQDCVNCDPAPEAAPAPPPFAAFIGGTRYALGVPARGLSREEWDALPKDQRASLVEQGLYAVPADGESAPVVAAGEAPARAKKGGKQ